MGFRTYLWDRRRSWLLALGLLAVLLVVLLLFRLPVLAVAMGRFCAASSIWGRAFGTLSSGAAATTGCKTWSRRC